ncbi:hypothetical protein [Cerasicoccus maritimus]|uniref:hypothetical protein n=1 Tax=Cerasicoccus maritimus TaxID=490089 RepID=UPI0028527C78|nr:hypothetical protein [Cerasicoccus maritimus]
MKFLLAALCLMASIKPVSGLSIEETAGSTWQLSHQAEAGNAMILEQCSDLEDWSLAAVSLSDGETQIHPLPDLTPPAFFQVNELPSVRLPVVLTEFSLPIGIFFVESFARHQLRFAIRTEIWNPTPVDIVSQSEDSRIYAIRVDGLPPATITNLTSGEALAVDMDNFSTELNSADRAKIWAWVDMRSTTLPAGNVFFAHEPDPEVIPRGLSRDLSGRTSPSTVEVNRSDQIQIVVEPAVLSVKIFEYSDANASLAPDFNDPIMVIDDLSFEGFTIELTGEQYRRSTSGSYQWSEANFGYTFRLKDGIDPAFLLRSLSSHQRTLSAAGPDSPFEIMSNPADWPVEWIWNFHPFDDFSDTAQNSTEGNAVIIAVPGF